MTTGAASTVMHDAAASDSPAWNTTGVSWTVLAAGLDWRLSVTAPSATGVLSSAVSELQVTDPPALVLVCAALALASTLLVGAGKQHLSDWELYPSLVPYFVGYGFLSYSAGAWQYMGAPFWLLAFAMDVRLMRLIRVRRKGKGHSRHKAPEAATNRPVLGAWARSLRRPDAAKQRDLLRQRLQPLGVAGCEELVVAFSGIWPWFGLFTPLYSSTRPQILCIGTEIKSIAVRSNLTPRAGAKALVLGGPATFTLGIVYDTLRVGGVRLYCHRMYRTRMLARFPAVDV